MTIPKLPSSQPPPSQQSPSEQPPQIEFLAWHEPALDAGDYEISIEQTITSTSGQVPTTSFSAQHEFSVHGERFQLNPVDIEVMFPKPGSTGDVQNILPHLVYRRSTLPWERPADEELGDPTLPWLALLLFDEDDAVAPQIVTVADLSKDYPPPPATRPSPAPPKFPTVYPSGKDTSGAQVPWIELELDNLPADKLTIIDVPYDALSQIMPQVNELSYLSHVRQGGSVSPPTVDPEDQFAVIVCNRLPKPASKNTVHLVSLEQRWNTATGFDYQGAQGEEKIRLVSLKHWDFYCSEHYKLTEKVLKSQEWLTTQQKDELRPYLNQEFVGTQENFEDWVKGILGGKPSAANLGKLAKASQFTKTLEGLLLNLNQELVTLRLPDPASGPNPNISAGFVPVQSHLRNGDRSYSWYHGPLAPVGESVPPALTEPGSTADQYLRFFPSQGLFDSAYAAAWQLGQLLALRDKKFSLNLYHYKRYFTQQQKNLAPPFLASLTQSTAAQAAILEGKILSWLHGLNLLEGVPFDYLVPSAAMLPPESIRFFEVDRYWVSCLLDGAFSIGRAISEDWRTDEILMRQLVWRYNNPEATLPQGGPPALPSTGFSFIPYLSGFLLRSEAVAGWPGLEVDGYPQIYANTQPIPSGTSAMPVHTYRLSDHVLLCLFEGTKDGPAVKTAELHQKPEVIHFGFGDDNKDFYKILKDIKGNEDPSKFIGVNGKDNAVNGQTPLTTIDSVNAQRVLDINSSQSNALVPTLQGQLSAAENSALGFDASQLKEIDYLKAIFALEMTTGVVKVRYTASS